MRSVWATGGRPKLWLEEPCQMLLEDWVNLRGTMVDLRR